MPEGEGIALGDGPWWERLPESFWRRRERFRTRGLTRASIAGTAALDRVVCTGTAAGLSTVFLPLLGEGKLQRQVEHLQFYGQERFIAEPGTFFSEPEDVPIARKSARAFFRSPRRAHCEDLSFEGAFDTVNPDSAASYFSHARNRVSRARHFFHGDRPRPTVIALHGFWASPYWINAFMFEIPFLYRLGLDVVLPTMPFHGDRRMQGSVFSGHGFLSPDLDQTFEAIAHTVSDVRVIMRDLERRGVPAMGVSGLSLGGYMTALLATLEPSLAFAIPNVPVVTLVDLLLDWHPLSWLIRRSLARASLSIQEARRMFAVHCPLTRPPAVPHERLMIIAGAGDRMAPPSQARLLWEHWKRPAIYYFPGNHLLHFDRGGYLRAQARFLGGLGLLEPR
jgi:pimeloyl-ACP methyl ester carboxylesterase